MTAVQDALAAQSAALAAAAGTSSPSSSASSTATDLQNRFLTLMVTQLQNQDPLNPMDNSEITSQLAEVSTVTGISQLNDTVKALNTSYSNSQPIQAAALVGHGVLIDGSTLTLSTTTSTTDGSTSSDAYFAVNLPSAADSVKVTIKDAAGNVVQSMDVGAQDAGNVMLHWDGSEASGGTAAAGTYTFSVAATANGKSVGPTSMSYGLVTSVIPNSNGTQIDVQGQSNPVQLSDVKQII